MKNFHEYLTALVNLTSAHGGHVTLKKVPGTTSWSLWACLPEGRVWSSCLDRRMMTRWREEDGDRYRDEQAATLLEYAEEGVVSPDGMALSPVV